MLANRTHGRHFFFNNNECHETKEFGTIEPDDMIHWDDHVILVVPWPNLHSNSRHLAYTHETDKSCQKATTLWREMIVTELSAWQKATPVIATTFNGSKTTSRGHWLDSLPTGVRESLLLGINHPPVRIDPSVSESDRFGYVHVDVFRPFRMNARNIS